MYQKCSIFCRSGDFCLITILITWQSHDVISKPKYTISSWTDQLMQDVQSNPDVWKAPDVFTEALILRHSDPERCFRLCHRWCPKSADFAWFGPMASGGLLFFKKIIPALGKERKAGKGKFLTSARLGCTSYSCRSKVSPFPKLLRICVSSTTTKLVQIRRQTYLHLSYDYQRVYNIEDFLKLICSRGLHGNYFFAGYCTAYDGWDTPPPVTAFFFR